MGCSDENPQAVPTPKWALATINYGVLRTLLEERRACVAEVNGRCRNGRVSADAGGER